MPANGPRLPKISEILQLNLSTVQGLLSTFTHHYHFKGLLMALNFKVVNLSTFKDFQWRGNPGNFLYDFGVADKYLNLPTYLLIY